MGGRRAYPDAFNAQRTAQERSLSFLLAGARGARSAARVFPVLSVLVIFSSEALTNTPYRDTGQRRPGGLGAFSVTGARGRGEFLAGMRPPLRSCWNG